MCIGRVGCENLEQFLLLQYRIQNRATVEVKLKVLCYAVANILS